MKSVLVLLLLFLSTGSWAGVDPDPNSVGIYFDTEATRYEEPATTSFVQYRAYLILCNPTTHGVLGWECTVHLDLGAGAAIIQYFSPRGSSINMLQQPEFAVWLAAPLPAAGDIVLMDIGVFYLEGICYFRLGPVSTASIPGQMAFVDGMNGVDLLPMYPSSGSHSLPVASMGTTGVVVDATHDTWGGLKCLFR